MIPYNGLHTAVLLRETITGLAPINNGIYVDGTFGTGGITQALLHVSNSLIVAIDQDPAVLSIGQSLAVSYPGRVIMINGQLSQLNHLLIRHGVSNVDGIVFDLGVSSYQLNTPERGFSFRVDGPLDMRMKQRGVTAQEVVNTLTETMLTRILFDYGEERHARSIARAIIKARSRQPITHTIELADIVRNVVPRKNHLIDPATRTFQALRIYVNDEIAELQQGLLAAELVLRPRGRLAVICFHSLEDRIVKTFLRTRTEKIAKPSRHMPYQRPETTAFFSCNSPSANLPNQRRNFSQSKSTISTFTAHGTY